MLQEVLQELQQEVQQEVQEVWEDQEVQQEVHQEVQKGVQQEVQQEEAPLKPGHTLIPLQRPPRGRIHRFLTRTRTPLPVTTLPSLLAAVPASSGCFPFPLRPISANLARSLCCRLLVQHIRTGAPEGA